MLLPKGFGLAAKLRHHFGQLFYVRRMDVYALRLPCASRLYLANANSAADGGVEFQGIPVPINKLRSITVC